MVVQALRTSRVMPPQQDILVLLKDEVIPHMHDEMIICIAAKIMSIHQGRCIAIHDVQKDTLVREEAEAFIDREHVPGKYVTLTKKYSTLIPEAGIDESNADDHYILWPEDPFKLCHEILDFLRNESGYQNIGCIFVDSHCLPMRYGTVGISIAYAGIHPLYDYRNTQDLFDRPMEVSQKNIIDGVAAAAVLEMGEGSEQTPIALVQEVKGLQFTDQKTDGGNFLIPPSHDLFAPLYDHFSTE